MREKRLYGIFIIVFFVVIAFFAGAYFLFWKGGEEKQSEDTLSKQDASPSGSEEFSVDETLLENLSPEERERMIQEMEQAKAEQEKINKQNEAPLEQTEKGYVGTFEVTGKAVHHSVPCEPQGMCGADFDYISFVPQKAKTNEAETFLEGKEFLGIGCYIEAQKGIFSQNYGDGGTVENHISGETLEKILASVDGDQVTLRFTKPLLSWEGTKPSCYSEFRNIELSK